MALPPVRFLYEVTLTNAAGAAAPAGTAAI